MTCKRQVGCQNDACCKSEEAMQAVLVCLGQVCCKEANSSAPEESGKRNRTGA